MLKHFVLFVFIIGIQTASGESSSGGIVDFTPNQIRSLLTPKQIEALTGEQFSQLRPEQISALKPDQIKSISNKQFSWFKADQMKALTPVQIRSLSLSQAKSFKPSQMQAFSPSQAKSLFSRHIESFSPSQLLKFTPSQMREGLSPNHIKLLDRAQLRAFGPQYIRNFKLPHIRVLNTEQIQDLEETQIKAFSPLQAGVLSKQQMRSLKSDQLRYLHSSQIKQTLRLEDISKLDLSSNLYGLGEKQAGSLTPSQKADLIKGQYNALSLRQFQSLTPEQIRAITPEQLRALDTNKLRALTREQVSALTPEQINELKDIQLRLFREGNMLNLETAKDIDDTEAKALCIGCVSAPIMKDKSETRRRGDAVCEFLLASPLCRHVPEDKKSKCDYRDTGFSPAHSIWGCLKYSIGDMIKGVWDMLKWIWSNLTDSEAREETSDMAGRAMDSMKLYLNAEYEKAYEEASPPAKKMKAMAGVTGSLGEFLYDSISGMLEEDINEWDCLSTQAQAGKICGWLLAAAGFTAGGGMMLPALLPRILPKLEKALPKNWKTSKTNPPAGGGTVDPPSAKVLPAEPKVVFTDTSDFRQAVKGITDEGEKLELLKLNRKSSNDYVRMKVADEAGMLADYKGDRILLSLSRDRDVGVRSAVGFNLHLMKPAKARDILSAQGGYIARNESKFVKHGYISGAGRVGGDAGYHFIRRFRRDKNPETRIQAVKSAPKDFENQIIQDFISDSDLLVQDELISLAFKKKNTGALQEILDNSNDPLVRSQAEQGLRALKSDSGGSLPRINYEELVSSKNPEIRKALADRLPSMGAMDRTIVRNLANDSNPLVQARIVQRAVEFNDFDYNEFILERLMKNNQSLKPPVKQAILQGLAQRKSLNIRQYARSRHFQDADSQIAIFRAVRGHRSSMVQRGSIFKHLTSKQPNLDIRVEQAMVREVMEAGSSEMRDTVKSLAAIVRKYGNDPRGSWRDPVHPQNKLIREIGDVVEKKENFSLIGRDVQDIIKAAKEAAE